MVPMVPWYTTLPTPGAYVPALAWPPVTYLSRLSVPERRPSTLLLCQLRAPIARVQVEGRLCLPLHRTR